MVEIARMAVPSKKNIHNVQSRLRSQEQPKVDKSCWLAYSRLERIVFYVSKTVVQHYKEPVHLSLPQYLKPSYRKWKKFVLLYPSRENVLEKVDAVVSGVTLDLVERDLVIRAK